MYPVKASKLKRTAKVGYILLAVVVLSILLSFFPSKDSFAASSTGITLKDFKTIEYGKSGGALTINATLSDNRGGLRLTYFLISFDGTGGAQQPFLVYKDLSNPGSGVFLADTSNIYFCNSDVYSNIILRDPTQYTKICEGPVAINNPNGYEEAAWLYPEVTLKLTLTLVGFTNEDKGGTFGPFKVTATVLFPDNPVSISTNTESYIYDGVAKTKDLQVTIAHVPVGRGSIAVSDQNGIVYASLNDVEFVGDTIDVNLTLDINEIPIPICESFLDNALGWIACQGIRFMFRAVEGMARVMSSVLKIRPLTIDATSDPVFLVWKGMRNAGVGLLVLGLIIAVIGQATSFMDAYTLKKMVPRLAFAAIGMTLSYYVAAFLVDVFNVIGGGIFDFMSRAAGDSQSVIATASNESAGIAAALVTVFAAGSTVIAFSPAVIATTFGILLPIVIAFLFALFTILLRQVVIVALVIVSPLAFAAWILPGTEKYFRKWWSFMTTMLIMYPLIMILLASANVFAYIITNGGIGASTNISTNNFFNYLMALAAMGAAVAAIPFTIRAASGVLGRITGALNDRSRGPIDSLRNKIRERRDLGKEIKRREAAHRLKNAPNASFGRRLLYHASGRSISDSIKTGSYLSGGRLSTLGRIHAAKRDTEALSSEQQVALHQQQAKDTQEKVAQFMALNRASRYASQFDPNNQPNNENYGRMDYVYDELMNDLERAIRRGDHAEAAGTMHQIMQFRDPGQLVRALNMVAEHGGDRGQQMAVRFLNENYGTINGFAAPITAGEFVNGEFQPNAAALVGLPPEALAQQSRHTFAQFFPQLNDGQQATVRENYRALPSHMYNREIGEIIGLPEPEPPPRRGQG